MDSVVWLYMMMLSWISMVQKRTSIPTNVGIYVCTQSQWSKHSFAFPTQYIPWRRCRQDRRQSIGGSIANININTDADGTFIHVYIRVYCWTCTVVCSCRQRRRRWLHSVSYKLLQGTLHVWVLFHITNILLLLLCVCMNVYHMHPGVHHHPRSTYYTCSS